MLVYVWSALFEVRSRESLELFRSTVCGGHCVVQCPRRCAVSADSGSSFFGCISVVLTHRDASLSLVLIARKERTAVHKRRKHTWKQRKR